MHQTFYNHISQLIHITREIADEIAGDFVMRDLARGDHWIREGQVCTQLGFIEEGYMRIYMPEEDEEKVVHIGRPGEFIIPFYSYIMQKPSFEYIQAVTPCRLWLIPQKRVHELYEKHPVLERLGRLITEKNFIMKEERVISFLKYSSEERYLNLLQNMPDVLQNIPLIYIASYLGIKPETLSRIRAKIR